MELGSFWCDTEDGFAEAVHAVGGGFEGLCGGIVRGAGDDDLDWVMGEERGSEAVGGGEEAILRGNAGKSFKCFLGEGVVAIIAGESVHANQGDGGDGIGARRGRILKGLAADIQAAQGGGVRGAIEEAATVGVTVACDGEVHGFLRGIEIARVESGFVGVEKR